MWNLYALSQKNDLLLMSFQKGATERKIATISLDEYESLFLTDRIHGSRIGQITAPFHP